MTDPIRDELHRLAEEFKKLLSDSSDIAVSENTSPDQLAKFGLTLDEAQAWLEHEPNFTPSDDGYHEPQNRRKVTRT